MEFTRNEINTLKLSGVGHFGCHLAMLVFPTAAVSIAAEENLPYEVVFGWSIAGYLLFGLGALPVGLLTDRTLAHRVVRTGVVGLGPALMLVALTDPGFGLAAALALVGFFASIYHPAGMSLISRTVAKRGSALGINGVFGNFGIAGAPIFTEIAAREWGWRGAYFALGAVLLILGLAVSALPINEPRAGENRRDEHHHEPRERLMLFLVLMVAMTLAGVAYRAATLVQPAFYAEKVAFIGYGTATTCVYLIGTAGQYIGGRLADRFDLRYLYMGCLLFCVPFAATMAAASGVPLLICASFFLVFSLAMQPIENSLVARFTPDRWRSTGYGLKFTVVFSIGALSVGGVQWIVGHFSLAAVFVAIAGVFAMMIFVTAFLLTMSRGQSVIQR